MKVLFLDIDGVLHPAGGSDASIVKGTFWQCNMVNMTKLALLAGNFEIVLSSSWRTSTSRVAIINRELRRYGLPMVFGSTPFFPDKTRVEEIWTWLEEYATKRMQDPDKFGPIEGYLCLDDMDLSVNADRITPSPIANHCCRVSSETGFTHGSIKRCARIMQRPPTLPTVDIFPRTLSDAAHFAPTFHANNLSYLEKKDSTHTSNFKLRRFTADGMPLPPRFNRAECPPQPVTALFPVASNRSLKHRASRKRLPKENTNDNASDSDDDLDKHASRHGSKESRPPQLQIMQGVIGSGAPASDKFQRKALLDIRVDPLCSHVRATSAKGARKKIACGSAPKAVRVMSAKGIR